MATLIAGSAIALFMIQRLFLRWTDGAPDRCAECDFALVYPEDAKPDRCPECGAEIAWGTGGRNIETGHERVPLPKAALAAAALVGGLCIIGIKYGVVDMFDELRAEAYWTAVHVEDVRRDGLDRIVLATPPGTTERQLLDGDAPPDAPGPVELRVHFEDGRVAGAVLPPTFTTAEMFIESLTAAGVPDAANAERAERLEAQAGRMSIRTDPTPLEDDWLLGDDDPFATVGPGERGVRVMSPGGPFGARPTSPHTRAVGYAAFWVLGTLALVALVLRRRRDPTPSPDPSHSGTT